MIKAKHILLLLISLPLVLYCRKEENNELIAFENLESPEALYQFMKEWYLWNEDIPDTINTKNYSSAKDFLAKWRKKDIDKWSSISNWEEQQQYYNNAEYIGYGFIYDWWNENDLRIATVFKNTPFDKNHIKRGWRILKINDINVKDISNINSALGDEEVGISNTFEFEKPDGEIVSLTIAKEVVHFNTILHNSTHKINNSTVGYMVYDAFVEPSKEEIDNTITTFVNQGVQKLILDLRYNGGGLVSVAKHLANAIAPTQINGQELFEYNYNKDKAEKENVSHYIEKSGSLEVNEIIFLVSDRTASASELIINGFQPLMNTKIIGTSNTYGKPVGSILKKHNEHSFSIVSFSLKNSAGYGEYFDGLKSDFLSCDDLNKDWGDETETMFADALQYIEKGSVSECTQSQSGRIAIQSPSLQKKRESIKNTKRFILYGFTAE